MDLFSPAKLNLFLAVTGRRADGFHDLVSVVSPLAWGDTLRAELAAGHTLECDDPAVPVDGTNLILKAARVFQDATGWQGGVHFKLEKRIPIGAGLGGGSSNAAAALRILNLMAGEPLAPEGLATLAAHIGSDCPLFLQPGPVVIRGRGERVEPLPATAVARLYGRRVLIFRPEFGISTPWAYGRLAAAAAAEPAVYLAEKEADARVASWLRERRAPVEKLLFNSLEQPAFAKYLGLPALLAQLRDDFGLAPRMSGSGSACFLLLPDELAAEKVAAITAAIRGAWGPGALVLETSLG